VLRVQLLWGLLRMLYDFAQVSVLVQEWLEART